MGSRMPRSRRFVWAVLALGLLLRVGVILVAFANEQSFNGDSVYYMRIARQPIRFLSSADLTSSGPLYPLFLVPFFNLIPDTAPLAQVTAARLAQAVIDTATVWLVYAIARELFGELVGRVALVAQALDVRYLFATGIIATETLFIALFAWFMLLYLRAAAQEKSGPYRIAGVALGLSVLTRPVPLLFPVLLAVHAWFSGLKRRRALRDAVKLRGVAWMSGVMLLVIAPWIVRTMLVTGEFVPIADTVFSQFWANSREDGREIGGSLYEEAVQEEIGTESVGVTTGDDYMAAGLNNVLGAPFKWLGRITLDTLRAYGQPYGTVQLIGPTGTSVRGTLRDVLAGQATIGDLLAIPGLIRRGLMYLLHFWALLFGIVGLVIAVREIGWRVFPLPAWIVYATGVQAALLIEPRYIFPVVFAFTILAARASVSAWQAVFHAPKAAPLSEEPA
jgi:4-amino-4-deoxy-L-arabinose transferase-like glycosyltransferase